MGCWGFGIRQSDDALDWQAMLYEAAEVDQYADDFAADLPATRAALEAHWDAMLATAQAGSESGETNSFSGAMGYQILAVLMMDAGAAMTERQRDMLVGEVARCEEYQAAKKLLAQSGGARISEAVLKHVGFEEDHWGYSGLVRRFHGRMEAIDALAQALRDYDINGGTPYADPQPGLFETAMMKQMGMVNTVDATPVP